MLGTQLAAALHEGHAGADKIHVAGNRLDHQAGRAAAVQSKAFFQLDQVVVFEYQRVLHHFRRHASAGWVAEGRQPGASLDQQGVGVAVVATFELDDLAATGRAARQANRTHRCLSARTDQPHHLDRRHELDDFFGEFDLALGRRTERKTFQQRFLHRVHDSRMTVPQNHRPPGADVVDIPFVIGVPEVGAVCPLYKTGCATHRLEGAHRGIHAAGNCFSGALKKLFVAGCVRSRLNHEGVPDQCLVMPWVGNLKRGAVASSSPSPGSPDSISVSSTSTSVCAQNIRSGTMLPMPGWNPASRL